MLNKKWVFSGIAVLLIGALAAAVYGIRAPATPGFIDPADKALVAQGKTVYASACAACHGAALEGQPNWRERLPNDRLPAPPHDETGHTWHHPDALLVDIVTHGLVPGKIAPEGYESDMPAFKDTLSDEEIVAVLAYIKSSWPARALSWQKQVTLQQQ